MARYFDIHDVLADETLLPVTFRYGAARVAPMFGGSATAAAGGHASAGSNADLPLWLCKILVSKELVKVKRPQFLGDRIQRRLTAGAACENLKARCAYFYAAAKGFSDLEAEPDVDLATVVFNAYRERFHKLAGGALGLDRGDDVNELQQKLSQEEAYLYEGAAAAAHQVQAWRFDHQVTSAIIQEKRW